MTAYEKEYKKWLESEYFDEKTRNELKAICNNKKEIEDRFFRELEFGTGGLRGIIGAGTNRMNIYTVRRATQGMADYINSRFKNDDKSVAVSYDTRHMSKEFAEETSAVFAANGIKAYLYTDIRPVPLLSFAVRHLKTNAGIMITASHNPKEYNGYKAYGSDGAQLSPEQSDYVISYVNKVKKFEDVKVIDFNEGLKSGMIEYIDKKVDEDYLDTLEKLVINKDLFKKCGDKYKIIYTPLHGTGNIPVRNILKKIGMNNVVIVKEQELPDPDFSTVRSPNPEEKDAFNIALDLAASEGAEMIMGTDPDCDRIGVVCKDNKGEFVVLSGNQTGCLLTEYILSQYTEKKMMPENAFIADTIVTSELGKAIAKYYNIELIEVLTGFKFIGEKILELDENGDMNYVFGFEESFGYLMGTHARDKDAVVTAMMIAEMFLYYKDKGMTLYKALTAMFNKYGYYKEGITSITLKGKEGLMKITEIMDKLRKDKEGYFPSIDSIIKIKDYKTSVSYNIKTKETEKLTLPVSNVLYYELEDNCWFCVRPSGTEPKIKIYYGYKGSSYEDSEKGLGNLSNSILETINKEL
jgi:phosphoglucomutase